MTQRHSSQTNEERAEVPRELLNGPIEELVAYYREHMPRAQYEDFMDGLRDGSIRKEER